MKRAYRSDGLAWVLFLVLSTGSLQAAPPDVQTSEAKQFTDEIKPILIKHCIECHGPEKVKANLRLDQIADNFDNAQNLGHWMTVLKRVKAGEMPVAERPPLSPKEMQVLTDWIAAKAKVAEANRAAQGRVVLRRLNRVEYENTVHDLLGIDIDLKEQLPADSSANGFDNVGDALHTSSFLMEKYLEAADSALNVAIANRPKPPVLFSKKISLKESHNVKTTTESVFRKMEDDTVICFSSSAWNQVHVSTFYPQDRGLYRFRISACAVQSKDKPVTFAVFAGGGRRAGKSGIVGYFDAPPEKPTIIEFVQYMEPRTTIILAPYGLAGANTIKQIGADKWEGPGLAVQYVEVEGPLHEMWPPANHRRVFGNQEQGPAPIYNFRDRVEIISKEPEVDAKRILRDFTRRAFRRAVTDEDINPYVALVLAKVNEKNTFEQAIRAAFMAVMVSPEFLFLQEKPGKLDDYALASRLSYFLWSTMPDDELLALAEGKKLSDPAILRQQVERLLKNPKALAFTENFVGQWLGLREIDATEPSHLLYPEFDHMLKVSMIRETELFFSEVLKDDLSLANFVSSDFSMLNGRLAKHYGIPDVHGWEFRKVKLPAESHRGGVLTMGSVLKVTANGTTTSPVMRGAWILDRILGTPPSPPPEEVAALDPDTRGAVTIRDQLAKHRIVATCASCHVKIDPPGFALESFDVIGGWRDSYRVTGSGKVVMVEGRRMSYHEGKKVEPNDVMPDGQKFTNIDEFKQILLKDKDQLARSLAEKLLTYATGGPPAPGNKPEIETIVASIKKKNYSFRTLVHEVVQSEAFRRK